jgi:two-component system chemotaxis response regulator CheV
MTTGGFMSDLMSSVDQRTQLAGRNRLELLIFRLNGAQLYGINVFKVREVLQCPKMSDVPNASPVVRGISSVRGQTISILDLSLAIGGTEIEDLDRSFVIIAEYNRSVQGFLVREVDRIVNLNWKDMHVPPNGVADQGYLTAVTYVNEELVEVIDVERILAEVVGANDSVSEATREKLSQQALTERRLVLVSDDSSMARKQICRTLERSLDVDIITTTNGKEAIELLKDWADRGDPKLKQLALVISDIEMPEMDGYTFTTEVRNDERLQHLYIILHTSMSGIFNQSMVDKVGANKFIAKFDPDQLAMTVMQVARS